MNLREKIRSVGGSQGGGRKKEPAPAASGCGHLVVKRAAEEFPGAWELKRGTLELMCSTPLTEPFDPGKILYLDTETTGLGGSGTVAFLVGLGFLTEEGFEVHQFLMHTQL